MKIIAGDIGGTNSRLVMARAGEEGYSVIHEQRYASANYADFTAVVEQFIKECAIELPVDSVCIAVAGPVKSGVASITNLPWVVSESLLRKLFKTELVCLLNDFSVIAYGIPELKETDTLLLQQGDPQAVENKDFVVMGAGTGLGAAHVIWREGLYLPLSSEAGHAGFAPQTPLQTQLLQWMQKQYEHVSVEMLLSGRGIYSIYQFLRDVLEIPEAEELALRFRHTSGSFDPARVITEAATALDDALCSKTLECFVEIYGSAAANQVLQYYPLANLYIAGGIASKIRHFMQRPTFIQSFLHKGKMSDNLNQINVQLITQENVGLYGSLARARHLLTRKH